MPSRDSQHVAPVSDHDSPIKHCYYDTQTRPPATPTFPTAMNLFPDVMHLARTHIPPRHKSWVWRGSIAVKRCAVNTAHHPAFVISRRVQTSLKEPLAPFSGHRTSRGDLSPAIPRRSEEGVVHVLELEGLRCPNTDVTEALSLQGPPAIKEERR